MILTGGSVAGVVTVRRGVEVVVVASAARVCERLTQSRTIVKVPAL